MSSTWLLSAAVIGAMTCKTRVEAVTTFGGGTFMVEQGGKIVTWPFYFLLPRGTRPMTAVLIDRWNVYMTGTKSEPGETLTVPETGKAP